VIAQEMAIAAAGLGSISEQQEWTIGRWDAVSALLPSHTARQSLRTAEIALVPYLLRFSHSAYESLWNGWRATAESSRLIGPQTAPADRAYPAGVPRLSSGRGVRAWLTGLFGARVRSG
jgi:hypothetical protein